MNNFRPDPKPTPRPKKKRKPLRQTKRIPLRSKKQEAADKAYKKRAVRWLEGRECPHCDQPAQQVHHKKGRKGYADKWAADRYITLLLDERFWLATCFDFHHEIELNPEWAIKYGYSLTRSDIIVK